MSETNNPGDFELEAAFHLLDPAGVLVRYTVRSGNANECMKRQEYIIKNRLDGGYTVPAQTSAGSNGKMDSEKEFSQVYTGFMIKNEVIKGKKSMSITLPFLWSNGEPANYPHMVFGSYVELFLKSIAAAGIQAETGELYDIPIKAVWKQGKEIPKKNPDDPNEKVNHYKNWQSFTVLKKEPAAPPAQKPPVSQPPQEEEIPF